MRMSGTALCFATSPYNIYFDNKEDCRVDTSFRMQHNFRNPN